MKFIEIFKNRFFIFILIFGAVLSLFPNLDVYEFRVEESLRTIVSFEMAYNHNLLQPTFLGEPYFNKPPLFNWFIIFSSIFIPWSELTARMVTISFLILTLLLIYKFSLNILKDKFISILSPLIYITFIDILFWYGYLAEIDVSLAFFITLIIYFQFFGFINNKKHYILFSGIIAGLAFLFKGFPAYVFFALTYISLIFYTKKFKEFFNIYIWISGFLALIIPLVWLINTPYPEKYIQTLFSESVVRAKSDSGILRFFIHIIEFPLENIKQLLPTSFFILIAFYLYFKKRVVVNLPYELKLVLFIVLINYIPYLLAVESRGRYVIPLFPILSIVFGYIMQKLSFYKAFVYTAIFLIFARFLTGFIVFPIIMEKKASRKEIAYDIITNIDISKNIACDCMPEKSICLYIDFEKRKPLKLSKYTKNWDYLIDCSSQNRGYLIKEYNVNRDYKVRLYKRHNKK